MSWHPHRGTSGQSNFVISKFTFRYKPFLKSIHKTSPYANRETLETGNYSEMLEVFLGGGGGGGGGGGKSGEWTISRKMTRQKEQED